MAKPRRKISSKLAQRYSQDADGRSSWEMVDPSKISRLVQAVSSCGCAVLFGQTSDGGALSLVYFEGSEKYKEYRPVDDTFDVWFLDQVEWWEGYAEEKATEAFPSPNSG